jgi:hypothetical protein
MLLHDGKMDRITRREPSISEANLFGTLGNGLRNVKHLIGNAKKVVECRLNGVPGSMAAYRCNISCRTSASVPSRFRSWPN